MHVFARWMSLVFLGIVSANADTSYFDEQRASGIWVFDLFASDREAFVTAPLDEAAKMICADHPCVKGFSTRISWRNIEPEEGKFDWRYTDRMFEIAEKYDKLVALRVIGWENWEKKEASPMWLWNKVAHYMDLNTTWQEVTRLPYLGKNTEFLRYWLRLNRALGERYAGNPRLQRIHMSTGYDQEMYYIKNLTPAQVQSFCPAGTDVLVKDLLDYWHETFLCYKEAFPGKAFVLDLSAPIQGIEGVVPGDILEQVVRDASNVFGAHLYLQQDGLSERNPMAKDVKPAQKSNRGLMISLQEQHLLGFETLLPPQQEGKMLVKPPAKLFVRDLRRAIDVGLSFPVRYMEFWVATLKDSATMPDIQYARVELEKRVAQQ